MVDIQASKAKKPRNPNWTRDELILALDVYLSHPDRLPGPTDSAVVELSALLNKLWASDVAVGGDTLRNVNGVSMKLVNFQRFDPKYAGQGLKGLPHGNRAEVGHLILIVPGLRRSASIKPQAKTYRTTAGRPCASGAV